MILRVLRNNNNNNKTDQFRNTMKRREDEKLFSLLKRVTIWRRSTSATYMQNESRKCRKKDF